MINNLLTVTIKGKKIKIPNNLPEDSELVTTVNTDPKATATVLTYLHRPTEQVYLVSILLDRNDNLAGVSTRKTSKRTADQYLNSQ